MKLHPAKADKYKIFQFLILAGCIALNILLSFLAVRFSLPLFLDSTGTVIASLLGGSVPGIIVAVFTNVIATSYNSYSLFFTLLNIFIALFAEWFAKKEFYRKKLNLLWFILGLTFIGGVLGSGFQWMIMGGPQNADIRTAAELMAGGSKAGFVALAVLMNVALNFIDKGISSCIAAAVMFFFPKALLKKLRDSEWKQKPLSEKEKKTIRDATGSGLHSIRKKITLVLAIVAITVTAVVAWISIDQHYRNTEEQYTLIAKNATELTARYVDGNRIDEFLRLGFDAEGYNETRNRMYEIKEYFPGINYLYVVRVEKDCCRMVFDLDTPEEPGYEPGETVDFDKEFLPYLDTLLAGGDIPPIRNKTAFGRAITVYSPVRNSAGRTTAYVGADVSIGYLERFTRDFMFRIVLVFSGFLVLILSIGIWASGRYLVYPIGSMALEAEKFVRVIGNQDKLDDNVKQMRKLEISTDDEVQMLYRAVCEMGTGMAEQVRELRYYSEATAKMQNGLIITMADMVENRDSDTGAHIQKTAAYVRIILAGLKKKGYYAEKLTPRYMSEVEMSAPLHDVGKISIPDAVLNKPGKLTEEEFEIMKTHTSYGKKIMEQAISTVSGENYLKEARNMAAYHHERWDGKGYPEGLYGQIIPLSARVMAVADVFDALTSPRVYKPPFSIEKAVEIIEEGAGKNFDPKVVEVFVEALPEVKVVLKKYQEM